MNLLELKAVLLTLLSSLVPLAFAIRLLLDNSTTVFALRKRGSMSSFPVTECVKEVREVCLEKQLQLEILVVPGKMNVLVD